jgi:hypothetical protein
MGNNPKTRIIAKEDAVFWLDRDGRWRNRHGPFEHKKIVDFFHRSIKRDRDGYYLYQSDGEKAEKVYFPCEDTALFVFDWAVENRNTFLTLNTGRKIHFEPERLFVKNDALYVRIGDEVAKFSERVLMQISGKIECRGEEFWFREGIEAFRIENLDSSGKTG